MESWYAFVIGTVAFFYIQSFNRIAKLYLESERSIAWNDFFTKVIPLTTRMGIEPMASRLEGGRSIQLS